MNRWKVFFKVLGALTVAACAAAAVAGYFARRRKLMDELDAYLMESSSSQSFEENKTGDPDLDYLTEDFRQLGSLEADESVTVSLLVQPSLVASTQEELAQHGYSSTYDQEGMILDIVLTGPKDEKEIDEFTSLIASMLKEKGIDYIGYALD